MKDKPNGRTLLQQVADWIEYALRFNGGKHLLGQQTNMPFCQQYLFDIVAFVVVITYLVYSIIRIICDYQVYRNCRAKKNKQD